MQILNHPDLVLVPYHLHPVTLPQQYQSIVAYTCLNWYPRTVLNSFTTNPPLQKKTSAKDLRITLNVSAWATRSQRAQAHLERNRWTPTFSAAQWTGPDPPRTTRHPHRRCRARRATPTWRKRCGFSRNAFGLSGRWKQAAPMIGKMISEM